MLKKLDDFTVETAYQNGYASYKVPGIAGNEAGTVICCYEGKKNGQSALFYRISTGDNQWSERMTAAQGGKVHNITPIGGRENELHLFLCEGYKKCYYIRSRNGGKTWSRKRNITEVFENAKEKFLWKFFAVSNGHGLRLSDGRLTVPVWMSGGAEGHKPAAFATLYSDDNGESWELGEILYSSALLPDPTECSLVQRKDKSLLATIRHNNQFHYRGFALSQDGGKSWETSWLDSTVPDPICTAGMALCPVGGQEWIALSNCDFFNESDGPALDSRRNLTIRLSDDGGRTFSSKQMIEKFGGYSDLYYSAKEEALYCIFESQWNDGRCFDPLKLSVARFTF